MNWITKTLIGVVVVLGIATYLLNGEVNRLEAENNDLNACQSKYISVMDTTSRAVDELEAARPVFQRMIDELDLYGFDAYVSADLDTFIDRWNKASELTTKAHNNSQDPKCFEVEGEASTGV